MQKIDTNNTYNLNLGEEGKNHKIWKVNVKDLSFNVKNGRITSEMLQKKSSTNMDLQKNVLTCFDELWDKFPEYEILYKAIEIDGQNTPLVINPNGIVIDGNTRLYLMKKLIINNKENATKTANVIILSKNYEGIELENFETKIQFQFSDKIQYSSINRKLKWLSMHNQNLKNGMDESQSYILISEKLTKFTPTIIKNEIVLFKYMQKIYLDMNVEIDYENLNSKNGHFLALMKAEKYLSHNKDLPVLLPYFKKVALHQIENNVTLIGSFRRIMPINKIKAEWMKNTMLFNEWAKKSLNTKEKDEIDFINYRTMRKNRNLINSKIQSRIITSPINPISINKKLWRVEFSINRLFDQLNVIEKNKNNISEQTKEKLKKIYNAFF